MLHLERGANLKDTMRCSKYVSQRIYPSELLFCNPWAKISLVCSLEHARELFALLCDWVKVSDGRDGKLCKGDNSLGSSGAVRPWVTIVGRVTAILCGLRCASAQAIGSMGQLTNPTYSDST